MYSIIEVVEAHGPAAGTEQGTAAPGGGLVFVKQGAKKWRGIQADLHSLHIQITSTRRDSKTSNSLLNKSNNKVTEYRTRWPTKTSVCARAQTAATRQARCNALPARSRV